jgi:hypothetical protein
MLPRKAAQSPVLQSCLLLVALLLMTGCSGLSISNTPLETIRGSGNVVTESREVSSFSRVELAGIGNVILTQDDTESLTIEAEDNLLPYITTEVRGGCLILNHQDGFMLENTEPIIFRVTLIDLAEVGVSGAGSITSDHLDVQNLSAYLSGTGNISLTGSVEEQSITLSGSGNFQGGDFLSHETWVTIAGTGNVVVNTSDTLNATINGTGFVQYLGSPLITENISGVGGVVPLTSGES